MLPFQKYRYFFWLYSVIVFYFYMKQSAIHFLWIDTLLAYFSLECGFYLLKPMRFKVMQWGLFFLFLLFFPNTIYLLTDLVHLNRIPFYDASNLVMTLRMDIWLMYTLVIIGVFPLILYGFSCVIQLRQKYLTKYSLKTQYVFLQVFWIMMSMGVFLGRFLRFNSIQFFTHPFRIFSQLHVLVTPQALFFILCFWLINNMLYAVISSFAHLNKE